MQETATITSPRYDAVVVGARCAGAATAMLLARQGLSVLLVDRDRHGADTLSTLALMRAGVLQLHRWGLLDRVRAAGTPAITAPASSTATRRSPSRSSRATASTRCTPRAARCSTRCWPMRPRTAGADVVYGPRLVDLERDSDGRVVGAVIEERGGALRRVGAGIVIGADGLRSTVAQLVEAATYREGRHACGVVYTFWPGLENARSRWYYRSGVSAGAIPTNDGDALRLRRDAAAAVPRRDPNPTWKRATGGCWPSAPRSWPARWRRRRRRSASAAFRASRG